MILPRLITAILGIPVILLAIHFGNIPFFIFVVAVVVFSLQECFFLLDRAHYEPQRIPGYVFGIMVILSVYFTGTKILTQTMNQFTSIMFTTAAVVFFLYEIIRCNVTEKTPKGSISRISVTFFAIFIISWTFGHLLLIRDLKPCGREYTFYLFLLIWVSDTFAYVSGTKFGRMTLSGKISPKKTIEGTIGGIVGGTLAGIILWKLLPLKEFKLNEIIILSIVIIILGYLSDLSESLFKRDGGLKDTDTLLPGHGGILDRFDSFLFSSPFLYYYLSLFK